MNMDVSDEILCPNLLVRSLAWIWIRLRGINERKYKDNGWDSYAEKLQFKLLKLCLSNRRYEAAEEMRIARISSRNFNLYAWDEASYGGQFNSSPYYKSWYGLHYIGDSLKNVATFDFPSEFPTRSAYFSTSGALFRIFST